MPLFQFIAAYSYYFFVSLGALIGEEKKTSFFEMSQIIPFIIGLILFFIGSYQQFVAHKILGNLRSKNDVEGEDRYKIPVGGYFRFVSSPHYLAEILIYLSFVIITRAENIAIILNFLFVVVNLTDSATRTHKFYLEKFGNKYPKSCYRLFPYVF